MVERGEVWKLCDFVRVSIMILIGKWSTSNFAGKIPYCIEAFCILPWSMVVVPMWSCLIGVVYSLFSTWVFIFYSCSGLMGCVLVFFLVQCFLFIELTL